MAIYSETLDDLVERICKLIIHDWWAGTATGGSTLTVVDVNNRNEGVDFFNSFARAEVYIRTTTDSAAPIGERRDISDFGAGTITVPDVFTAAVASGDTYSIHVEFPRDEVVEAINTAIDMVAEEAMVWAIDETTITLVVDTYEYSLPSSFMFLYRATMADADGNFDGQPAIPPDQWRILHSSTPQLRLSKFPVEGAYAGHYYGALWAESDLVAGRKVRLEGMASPSTLSSDTAVCPISPAYIAFQAGALLHASRVQRSDNEPDDRRTQYQIWQSRADIERKRVVAVALPPNAKRVRE